MGLSDLAAAARPRKDFPGGSDGKASVYNVGDPDSSPGSANVESAQYNHWLAVSSSL